MSIRFNKTHQHRHMGSNVTDRKTEEISHFEDIILNHNEKSARMRRKHCALAVVRRSQKFRPAADPLPGGAGRPNFDQLEMITTFTYKTSLVRIDARNFELSWYHTHKQTNRGDYNTLRRSFASAQCNSRFRQQASFMQISVR